MDTDVLHRQIMHMAKEAEKDKDEIVGWKQQLRAAESEGDKLRDTVASLQQQLDQLDRYGEARLEQARFMERQKMTVEIVRFRQDALTRARCVIQIGVGTLLVI